MKEILLNEVTVISQIAMPTRRAKLLTTPPDVTPANPLEALAELELVLEPEEYLDLMISRQRSREKR